MDRSAHSASASGIIVNQHCRRSLVAFKLRSTLTGSDLQVAACAFRFLRHHAGKPPLAAIRPGMPVPTTGPGTGTAPPVTNPDMF